MRAEVFIERLPEDRELIEWFISGGKDHKGVSVRINLETHLFEPDRNFGQRVEAWRNARSNEDDDMYALAEMPTLALFNAYLNGGAHFNRITHKIEYRGSKLIP